MIRLPQSVFSDRVSSVLDEVVVRIALRAKAIQHRCAWIPIRGSALAAGILLVALGTALRLSMPQLSVLAAGLGLQGLSAQRLPDGALVIGSNGAQTGIANFLGDLTLINPNSTGLFLLQRQPDCSLNLITGSATASGATVSLTVTGNTAHYEQTLHQLASLSTTADVYPLGCAEKSTGISTRPGVYVGMPQTGTEVSAAVIQNGGAATVRTRIYKSPYTSVPQNIEPTLTNASAVATGDLNGDGNGDIVVVNANFATSSYISIMLGKSDGTFQPAASYTAAGNYTVAAVIDDVNADGKLDVVAVSADQQISVFLGKGDGTFQSALSFAAPVLTGHTSSAQTPIISLITADVNGDGKKDVVCSNGLVLLGKSDGTFTPVATPAFPYFVDSLSAEGPNLAAGDINKDGKTDIAISDGSKIYTWMGNGDGTFVQGRNYAVANTTGFISLTDLDGDGNLDVYVGMGNGGFYSGDDSDDNEAYVLMGNGDGTFQGAPAINSGGYNGNNLADLNGDGVPDLVTMNNGTGQQTTVSGSLTVQLGNGKGGFTQGANIAPQASFSLSGFNFTMTSAAQASSFAIGDVNGDNKPDVVFIDNGLTAINPGSGLAISYPYPVLFVAIGNGDGTFQTAVPYAFPQIAPAADFDNTSTVTELQIADVNHDGLLDLIAVYNETAGGTGVNAYNQGIVVLPGNGNGTFKAPVLTSTYSSNSAPTTALVPTILNVIDLTGDHIPDLVVNFPGTTIINFQLQTQLQLFVANGDGTFKAPATIAVGADSYAIAFADFNNDTRPDLAVLAESSGAQAELAILLGNGDGTFGTAAISNLNGGDAIRSAGLAAADFDGDGKQDLALIDSQDYGGIFYGKGDGTFTSVPLAGDIVPKDLINIVAASPAVSTDLNKDGKPDIVAGGVSLLNFTGSTTTSPATTTTTVSSSLNPAVVGASVKFTGAVAGASGSSGTPSGTVTFLDGSSSLGTGSLTAGTATFTTSALSAGSHSITAVYGGDANFTASTSSALTELVNKATPTVSVTPSASSITTAQSLSVTIAVSGTAGNPTPTGSVTLSGGGYTSAGTALVSGSAAITIPAGALAAGTDVLTANYTPDSASSSTYNAGSGTNSVLVTLPAAFALSNSGSIAVSRGAGSGNTSTITVTPSGGFTGSVALTAAVATSPAGATNPPTFSFGSSSAVNIISASAATSTLTVSTTAATSGALVYPSSTGSPWYAAGGGVTLAGLIMLVIPAKRRRRSLIGMILLLGFICSVIGSCGGGTKGGGSGNPGTTSGSYTITVAGTSGTVSNTTTVNLTVN